MRRGIVVVSIVSVLLGACTTAAPTGTKTKKPVTAKATAKPSAKPSTAPTPKPSASVKPALLEGPTALLKGKIEIDAYYIVSNKAGTVIANNGAATIALNAGTLISNNGLGLIANNGMGLISDNGLGLIANNSAGLIGNNAGSFRLLAADGVALGTILPVKGMAVLPLSMRTGEIIGKAVLTDAAGGYTLEVPEQLRGSVRIVARVPVAKADDPIASDPRLQYNIVVETKAAAKASQFDEDTALVTKYLRACVANTFKDILLTDDVPGTTTRFLDSFKAPDLLLNALKALVSDLNAASKTAKVSAMSDAQVEALSQRLADVLLSYIDLDKLEVDPVALKRDHVQGAVKELAIPAMIDVLSQVRNAAKAKMLIDPVHFDTHPLIVAAKKPYTIRKPSDLGDFMVEELMLSFVDRYEDIKALYRSIDVPVTQAFRMNTVTQAILMTVGQTMLTSAEAKVKMVEAIHAVGSTAKP